MKARKTWILIADGARARIVRYDGPAKGLTPALKNDFAAVHASTRDFGADKPGRSQGGGVGSHHVIDAKTDWHMYEKHLFAVDLAKELEQAQSRGAFDDLVLVAPPRALGELRNALSKKVKNCITAELDKDLTHVSIYDLKDHLEGVIHLS